MSHLSASTNVSHPIRERLLVRGRVQGVGFRPFVYRLASGIKLTGRVGNDSHGAFIEIQGPPESLELFKQRLVSELPPLARIAEIHAEPVSPLPHDTTFEIQTSADDGTQDAEITPDTALCADCRRELFDPANRRYRYPFINCTNCGPRYSIIRSVPYDRPGTTMAKFKMCPACQAEYDNPADRRFHAQPNACAVCGPRVWLQPTRADGNADTRGDPIAACVRLIQQGKIVAIKGLGGFHLACRADDDQVVARLRERKSRESKPLALMVADLNMARELAEVDEAAAAALTDVVRPIVLLPKRRDRLEAGSAQEPGSPKEHRRDAGATPGDVLGTASRTGATHIRVSRHVAPGTDMLGIMLPYTPLHELLFAEGLGPVIMTSGNPTEEPLCCDNEEAWQRLTHIADAFLLHDRDIERRVDDSVVFISDVLLEGGSQDADEPGPARIVPIRRARGLAPAPIRVPMHASRPVLAVGAELKSTVCVVDGHTAIVSEHLGELANAKAYRNFVATVEQFKRLLRVEPQVIAYDLHPEYSSTRYAQAYAREHGLAAVAVQHHHAHMAGVMAENGLTGRVLGILCDGTGFGTDGAIWGCELLVGDESRFERAGHLRYFPLLGGDAAARETWRPAAGLLYDCFGANWTQAAGLILGRVPREALELAEARLAAGRLPPTSSLGRLFDAVAFLLGFCDENQHEAQAAMALEAAARTVGHARPLAFELESRATDGLPASADTAGQGVRGTRATPALKWDIRPTIREILIGLEQGRDRNELARAFHETVVAGLSEAAVRIARDRELDRVALSGGCFANRLLLASLARKLQASGLKVYANRLVPTGDGGVSLGQAVCAATRMANAAVRAADTDM